VIFTYRRDDLGVRIEQVDAAMREGMDVRVRSGAMRKSLDAGLASRRWTTCGN